MIQPIRNGILETDLDANEFSIINLNLGVFGFQPLDADLTAIAALTTLPFGRGGLAIADEAAFRSYIGAGDALTTNPISQFAATTSAQLRGVVSDETGTGALVFADSPTLITPLIASGSNLGFVSLGGGFAFLYAPSIAGVANITLPSASTTLLGTNAIGTTVQAWDADLDTWATKTPYAGALTIATGKTFNVTGTLTLAGTDGATLNIGGGGTLGTAAYTAATAYETALGNPAQNGWVLGSTAAGVRAWQRPGGYQIFNVLDYGAWTDGTHPTETKAAVWAAEAAAAALGGGVVFFPLGRYAINGYFYLTNENITWRGAGAGPHTFSSNPATVTQAPTLLITEEVNDFVFVAGRGRTLEDLVFVYPNQIPGDSVAPIVPVVYPYTLRIEVANFTMRRCTFYNSYDAIRVRNGRCSIDDCSVFGIHNDFFLDRAVDICWFHKIIGGSGYMPTTPSDMQTWMVANKIGWDIRKADGFRMSTIQAGTSNIAIKFSENRAAGDVGYNNGAYGSIVGLDIDGCNHGIWASSTRLAGGGVNIANFDIGPWTGGTGSGITVVSPEGGIGDPTLLRLSNGAIRGTWAMGPVTSPQTANSGLVMVNNVSGCDVPFSLKTSPTVPASTVALVNPYPFRVFVNVIGGTITAVSISGQAAPIVRGQYELQSGDTIAITYSVAPTWTWSNNWQAIPRADYVAPLSAPSFTGLTSTVRPDFQINIASSFQPVLRLSNFVGSGQGGYIEWFSGLGSKSVGLLGCDASGSSGSSFTLRLLRQATGVFTNSITIDNAGLTTLGGGLVLNGNIATDTTTGTKIGTATAQKLGFWNATPVVQPTAVTDASGGAIIDIEGRAAINGLLAKLRTIGIITT